MLVVFLLTLLVEDRPLFGINPDIQIVVAGVLSALAGLLAYAGADRSPKPAFLGAGLGLAGFAIVLLATMAIVASFPGSAAYYHGWTVETTFEEEWNATTARQALEDEGFNVTTASEEGLRAHKGEEVRVRVDAPEPGTLTLRVTYADRGEEADSFDEARDQADDARPQLENRFQAFLEGFEATTGWEHSEEPTWEPLIAVT